VTLVLFCRCSTGVLCSNADYLSPFSSEGYLLSLCAGSLRGDDHGEVRREGRRKGRGEGQGEERESDKGVMEWLVWLDQGCIYREEGV
jgi:hypothetical protein